MKAAVKSCTGTAAEAVTEAGNGSRNKDWQQNLSQKTVVQEPQRGPGAEPAGRNGQRGKRISGKKEIKEERSEITTE